ncbi:Gfo/Idh/MocA family protein [Subtercola boreus]|uniref:Gfo/Idh/MocA family protein n=1 Tax=Subtercola boreus TaxID=120213 RepID=UPI00209C52B2|nr:Gfo/Idh/MocA family oxidoreductase [Subtercola boreus]
MAPRFFDLPFEPVMQVLSGRSGEALRSRREQLGWAESETDWRRLVERDDIDLIDICSPGDTHAEVALAALAAGKHVLCEKPLANTVAEASEMAVAAQNAASRGVFSMVGFSYRRVPAIAMARRLIAEGRVGQIRQVRVSYLQDWLSDPEAPMTWRLDKAKAGLGTLGDLGAHAIDLAQFVSGETVDAVSGLLHTFVTERPLLGKTVGLSGTASAERGTVTVGDVALVTGRLSGGGLASFEATRYATGRKNALRLEISGSIGAVAFDLERMNELEFYDAEAPPATAGFTRILVTEPEHPYLSAWWPAGHTLGYEHGFTHQVVDLLEAIAEGRQPEPSFDAGLQVQSVLAAVEASSEASGAWLTTDNPAKPREMS